MANNKTYDRTDRTLATRDTESRTAEPYRYRPAAALPDAEPEEGFKHKYVALSILGEEQPAHVARELNDGWVPCTAAEQPRVAKLLRVDPQSSTIIFGGLQLCKIPIEIFEARNAYYEQRALEQSRSVKQKFESSAGAVPSMPIIDTIDRSQVEMVKGQRKFGSGE